MGEVKEKLWEGNPYDNKVQAVEKLIAQAKACGYQIVTLCFCNW
jgi:hypothetical protein